MTIEELELRTLERGRPYAHYLATGVRPLVCTIRRTRNAEFVQFTYLGKRISREQAKELVEG